MNIETLKTHLTEDHAFPETLFPILEEVGAHLRSNLIFGGYRISTKKPDEMRLITNDDKYLINLYDDGESSEAVYSLPELETNIVEPLKAIGFDFKWEYDPLTEHFFTAFPVASFMEFVGDYIPSDGLVTDRYEWWKSLDHDDTDYAVECWFDNLTGISFEDDYNLLNREVVRFIERYGSYPRDSEYNDDKARENIVLEWLAQDLRSFVNRWDEDSQPFEGFEALSQWELFCELSNYPTKEDYFGGLSHKPNYDRLFTDSTYISYERAVKEIQDWHEKSATKVLDVFKMIESKEVKA